MFMDVRDVQSWNALAPIEFTLSGIFTSLSPLPLNAASPISVTLPGMFMDVRDVQPKKAPSGTNGIPLGMVALPFNPIHL